MIKPIPTVRGLRSINWTYFWEKFGGPAAIGLWFALCLVYGLSTPP